MGRQSVPAVVWRSWFKVGGHGNLKPQEVMMTTDPGRERVSDTGASSN